MKKLLHFFAAISVTTSASAQLQNLDFENWESPISFEGVTPNNPNGWRSCQRWFGTEHALHAFTFQNPVDSNAQNNDYAIRLNVWYHNAKDAAYQSALIDYKPTALKGYYKYEDNRFLDGIDSITDTAQVSVLLTKWNTALEKEDTIGFGKFETATPTSTYTAFNVNINYFSTEMPEKITIFLDPSIIGRYYERNYFSAEDKCSWFTVDNLSLINGTTGINEIDSKQNLSVYPNPSNDKVNFEPISGNVIITDISGKQVMTFQVNNEGTIDIQHLNTGIYLLQIGDEKKQYRAKFIKQ